MGRKNAPFMFPRIFSNSLLTALLGLSCCNLGLGLSHSVDLSESSRGIFGLETNRLGLESIIHKYNNKL